MIFSGRKPKFRFFPRAYEIDGVFERSRQPCSICETPAEWLYVGSVYSVKNDGLEPCALCVSAGRIGEALGGASYSLRDADLSDDVNSELETEIMERTPGFATFNPFDWPAIDGLPLAFLGYGDEACFKGNKGVDAAIRQAGDNSGFPSYYALIFGTLDGATYKAEIDLD